MAKQGIISATPRPADRTMHLLPPAADRPIVASRQSFLNSLRFMMAFAFLATLMRTSIVGVDLEPFVCTALTLTLGSIQPYKLFAPREDYVLLSRAAWIQTVRTVAMSGAVTVALGIALLIFGEPVMGYTGIRPTSVAVVMMSAGAASPLWTIILLSLMLQSSAKDHDDQTIQKSIEA